MPFISMIKTKSERLKARNIICRYFSFYELLKFRAHVVERKYFTCFSRESNPGRWINRQTLYHVAVKAGFYRKAVEVCYIIPRPCDIHPLQFEIRPRISWYRNHVKMNPREIFMHETVIGWVIYGGRHCRRAKIFYLPQPGIEPRSLD